MRHVDFDKDVLRSGDFGWIGTFFCSQVIDRDGQRSGNFGRIGTVF